MSGRPGLISVIVSTYNWPQALAAVLAALAGQTDRDFEVVVADDGSTAETAALVGEQAAGFPVPLRQVWQEDQGFRAAACRNRAVAASIGDYLLFLDGDCLVRPDFIASHRLLSEPGRFVAGNRILLSESLTGEVLAGRAEPTTWSAGDCLRARLRGGINRILPLLRLPDQSWRRLRPRRWQGAMTCNLAVWRDDFYRVNGFNEAFVGWGHEDAEFVGRLINAGIYRKEGRFAVPVLHLWHHSQDRGGEAENLRRLHQHLAAGLTRAEAGVDRYSAGRDNGRNEDPVNERV
jgi:glycosyltransferase involved in cell wall biosynthesis